MQHIVIALWLVVHGAWWGGPPGPQPPPRLPQAAPLPEAPSHEALTPQPRPPARKKTPPPAPVRPAADRWPLAAIQVTGNKAFPTEAIAKASGLKLGEMVRVEDLRRAVDPLAAAGRLPAISCPPPPHVPPPLTTP